MGEIVKFKTEIVAKVYESENWKIYGGMPALESRDLKFHTNKYGNLTLVGNLPPLDEYQMYEVEAEHVNDPKFGHQYKIINISRDMPKTGEEIKLFLTEILTEEQAHEVYAHYPDIIDIVKEGREGEIDTSKMYNIGSYRIDVIVKKIQESYVLMELISEFSPYGLNMSGVKQLYQKYKNIDKVREVFQSDPYKMIIQLSGFAFKKADNLILKKKPELINSYVRCKSYVDKLMIDNESQGNTIIKMQDIMEGLKKDVPETREHFSEAIKAPEFKMLGELMIREKTYMSEKYIADTIIKMQYFEEIEKWEYDFSKINEGKEFPLTDEQIDAIKLVLENNVTMLFSSAGTGKSFCMKTLLEVLDSIGKSSIWLAPTGKAGKIIKNYIGRDASTIHRGLDYNPMYMSETGSPWGYNENNKLPYDVVVIDESSMIDVDLMESLLKAIDIKTTKLFLVGDAAQIPSVSKGNVSYDLLQSGLVPTATLSKVFRYKEGGMAKALVDMRNGKKFYHEINYGLNVFGDTKDYILYRVTQEKSTHAILKIYDSLIKKNVETKDIVIIMAQNVHEHGTININKIIQSYLLKNTDHLNKSRFIEASGQKWYVGDIVMQTKNNYKVDKYIPDENFFSSDEFGSKGKAPTVSVFNGDSGRIVDIVGGKIIIEFDGIKCAYTKDMFSQLLLGYAVSIHKMQGSQSPYVILSTPKAHTFQMNKNLLYTGASRTQKKLFHVTDEAIISSALRKSATFKRNTLLRPLLIKAKQGIDDVPF